MLNLKIFKIYRQNLMVLSFLEDALAHLFSDRKVQIQPYKEKTICRVIIIFILH